MKKEILEKLPKLYATASMMKKAKSDMPVKTKYGYYSKQYYNKYKISVYMRCQITQGILKVAFFLVEPMRLGSNKAAYELYIDKNANEFVTYDNVLQTWREAKVDMLEKLGCFYNPEKFINKKDDEDIKNYLGTKNGGYEGILEYQRAVRAIQLKKRHKKETDPWDLKMEQIPKLPKDWTKWVAKCGITENFIFYTYDRKGATTGYCTWCEKDVKIKNPKHNTYGKCKHCSHDIQFKSMGKAGYITTTRERAYLLQKCKDGFVVRRFEVFSRYSKDEYKTPQINCFEERRVIYNQNLEAEAFYFGDYKQAELRWIKGIVSAGGYYSYNYSGEIYKRTISSLKDKLKRTGLMEMIKQTDTLNPETFLASLNEKPYLEKLAKLNLTRLVNELLYSFKGLDIKDTGELGKALKIDNARLNRLRKNNGGTYFLKWLKHEKLLDKIINDNVISWFEKEEILPKDIEFISDRMSEMQIANYLVRQMKDSGRRSKDLISTWHDYLKMASRVKMSINDAIVYRAKKLVQRHDELVELVENKGAAIRAGEIAELFPNVDRICEEIKGKYEFENNTYAILAPQNIEDVIAEGNALHHCIDKSDKYFERINTKESFILFLRKKDDVSKPYYTLEVEPSGTIRQKRAEYDRQNPDLKQAEVFLKEWQKIVKKRISADDIRLAEESKAARLKEFEELRQNNVLISHGHLSGKSLADVLEADLMEAEKLAV